MDGFYLHFAEERKAEVPTIVIGPKLDPTNPRPPVSVEQKEIQGNGNVASGVNTGTISVTVTREQRQNKEQK